MYEPSDVGLGLPYRSGTDSATSPMFPDPFLDMASLVMPRNLKNVLDMCEGIWLKNGTYRMAASRIARYFITDIEYGDIGDSDRDTLQEFLDNKFYLNRNLGYIGDDFLSYGNSFTSIVLPFRRHLRCTKCHAEQPISTARWEFKDWKFVAHCRKCGTKTPHKHVDRRSTEEDGISVKRWAPQQFRIRHHPYNGLSEFYWDIPQDIKSHIQQGNPFFVEHMPWEIIDTIKQQKLFRFNPGVVYHMREDTLAGVQTRGWGVSRLLSNFAQAWYCQILQRYNEALAQDYVVPFRTITPMAQSKEGDPLLNMNLSQFSSKVQGMLVEHRRDPASWHTLPFPINYQALGGEAKNLTTPELLDQGLNVMLNGIGIPAELYRGTLQWQAYPTALRMFQQTWPHLVAAFNGWIGWAVNIVCTHQNWNKPGTTKLRPVTLADDIEQRQMLMQLASANMVSKQTAFSSIGVDARREQQRIMEEQRDFEDMQRKYQEDMAQQQMNRQYLQPPQPGGQPQPPGMGAPVSQAAGMGAQQGNMTPQDMMQEADAMAQQLLSMPYENRRSQMMDVKQQNPTLHALVKAKMEDYRSQASSVGQQAVLQGQV